MTGRGGLCAVVLAAGEGRRLRPLTELLPKALCPVGNVALLDHALRRVGGLGPGDVAVNAPIWPTRSSRTSATARTSPSSRTARWAPPAASAT